MTVDRETPIRAIRDQILRNIEHEVNSNMLYWLKAELVGDKLERQSTDFDKIPIFLDRLYKANLDNDSVIPDGGDNSKTDRLVTDLVTIEDEDGISAVFRRVFIGP